MAESPAPSPAGEDTLLQVRIRPLPGWAVIEPTETRSYGIIEIPDSAKAEMQQGTVVAVNPSYHKDGVLLEIRVDEGDTVAFRKYYDNDLEIGGKKYKMVHADNIMAVIN